MPADQLNISVIQPDIVWEDKEANLKQYEEYISGIKEPREVVVLPEMFSTGFSMQPELLAEKMNGETVEWMKKIASSKKIILTGSVIIEDPSTNPQGDKKYYNRLIWMLPNGDYGIYDKRHLFAYANEHNHYSSGNKRLIAQVKGWKINLLVCYDLRFPNWAKQPTAGEYDVLIYVANRPERRITALKTLLRARAIENQCYVIGANRVGDDGNNIHYSGESMIIDPLGEILYHKANEEDVFTYTLQKEKLDQAREKFPFWRDADSFEIVP
jgi:predicted amidohydrolase